MPLSYTQISHHGAGGRCVISCAARSDNFRCVGPFHDLWHVWATGTLQVTSSYDQQGSLLPCLGVLSLLSPVRDATCVCLRSTQAHVTRNRVRMSSTGEELSKYSPDDLRRARAVWKLGVVGLDGGSTVNSLVTQQVLHQVCELLQPS